MHLRWRGLDLPANVIPEQKSRTATFSRFTAEPFEPGFGTTVGNSLRRVLLSAIEGAAITKVKTELAPEKSRRPVNALAIKAKPNIVHSFFKKAGMNSSLD